MTQPLPERADLEHLKTQAKTLLSYLRAGVPDALTGAGEILASYRLADAQRILAREYGFPSWTKLKHHVESFKDRRAAFFQAVRGGDRELVVKLLNADSSLVRCHDEGNFGAPAISTAAERDDRPMIDLLLKHGADIDARSEWWAGSFGALDLASEPTSQYLLSCGATLTAHAAARLGRLEELKEILRQNPDAVAQRGGDGQYPLHFAKTPEIVDVLIDAGADLEARDLDHQGTSAQTQILNAAVLRKLVDRGAQTDIFMAIALDDLPLVKEHMAKDPAALNRRVDEPGNPMIPSAPGRHVYNYSLRGVRPFQAAINFDRHEIYEELMTHCPPSMRAVGAAWKGDRDAMLQILRKFPYAIAELADKDRLLLCESAKFPRPQALSLLLEAGLAVNTADPHEKMTAIHWASFHGRDDLIEIILPYKPDLEQKNSYGGSVLGTGIHGSQHGWWPNNNFVRSTELLIAAGAVVPKEIRGSPEVAEVLRRHGAATSNS